MSADVISDFRAVIEAAGLRPEELITDGELHRCPVDGKPNARDGAYVFHPDPPASGWWLNWRTGDENTWTAKKERDLSPTERQMLHVRIEADRRKREAETAVRHTEAADKARRILATAPECVTHPYLERKDVECCPGLKIRNDGRLVVPVLSPEDGKPMSLHFIAADGDKRFLTGGRAQGGYFAIPGDPGRLYICEGLATGLSVHAATGQAVLCAFNCGNLEAVARHARAKHPDREIVLCAEDDHATDGNPGLSKATAAALAVGALLAVPSFKEALDAQGKPRTDFNDLHVAEGLDAVREQLAAAAKPESPRGGGRTGAGSFFLRKTGVVIMEEDKDGNQKSHWVCSPLRIQAHTRNAEGEAWGLLVEVQDPEGNVHRWAMPKSLMAGNGDAYRSELLNLGLALAPGQKGKQRLDLYLSTARVERFARCVERIGWHGGVFVLPDAVYGDQAGEDIVPQGLTGENPFRQKGSLADWQENVARVCVGNSRLVFAVSAALAGPLLEPLGAESGGFHFVGGSSLGKTTALRVAGSVCGGGPSGFLKQWRATDNGLEGIAAAHCDSLLCLDEMGQATGKVASEVAYMLANGQGKNRAGKEGQARKAQTWRVLFLSTGEVTLADKVAEDGKGRARAGQAVRVVDIPADAGAGLGLFETLHGGEDAGQFARRLKDASAGDYGTALRAFLQCLAADRDNLACRAQEIMRTFEVANGPTGADGQVQRVCGRFALVAAAGELGASLGVLPWPSGEASKAATTCFRAWVALRGGIGAAEISAGLEQVRRFFQAHGAARFEDLDADDKRTVVNRAGYLQHVNGESVFLVFPEVFRREVCAGFNHKLLCAELIRLGLVEGQYPRQTKKLRNPKGRFYVVRSSILSGDAGDSGDALEPPHIVASPVEDMRTGDTGDIRPDVTVPSASVPAVPKGRSKAWGRWQASNSNAVPSVPTVPMQKGGGPQRASMPDRVTL